MLKRLVATGALTVVLTCPTSAAPGWAGIDKALGRPGAEQPEGVRRYSFPRPDLRVTLVEAPSKIGSGPAVCSLTASDLAANARLTFKEFDQQGVTAATARKLGDRGCFLEAARATEHYLINGPLLSPAERAVVTWHLGQYLAAGGKEEVAASVIASTRRPIEPAAELDWNSYVAGTWAFLTKDKALP